MDVQLFTRFHLFGVSDQKQLGGKSLFGLHILNQSTDLAKAETQTGQAPAEAMEGAAHWLAPVAPHGSSCSFTEAQTTSPE